MANQRQIPFLHWRQLASGHEAADWKPSPHLRNLGWTNRKLGIATHRHAPDAAPLIQMALALNQQVAEWRAGSGTAQASQAPRRRTVADALAAYRQSQEWTCLRPATHREYNLYLNRIEAWALDGRLFLDQLDDTMCLDLRAALLAPRADGSAASLHTAGAMFRVLRLWLNWCKGPGRRWIAANPADDISIKSAPSRKVLLLPDEVEAAAMAADLHGEAGIAAAIRLDLWMFQRAGDVRDLNQLAWREIDNCAAADRAVLAGPPGSPTHGKVMGFRLRQGKTDAWVDCPVPPSLHATVQARFAVSQWLVHKPGDPASACPEKTFQRRVRQAFNAAGLHHAQYRDLRRAGMCMFRDLGVHDSTPISGHMILGKPSVLDIYMPANTRAACAAVAEALRTLQARERREQGNG